MNNTILMTGIGGLIVGFLLGNISGRSTAPDPDDIAAALDNRLGSISERIDGVETGLGDRLGALEEGVSARFDAVDSSVSEGFSSVGSAMSEQADAFAASTEGLRGDLGALGENLTASIGSAVASAGAAVSAAVVGSDDATAEAEAEASAETEETDAEASAPAAEDSASANSSGSATGSSAGQTITLADGALRVFVSRVNGETGKATVAVNGLERTTLSAGFATEATGLGGEACLLSVDGVEGRAADLSASCGDARPAPAGASAGSTVTFGDTRVFVSRADAGTARIAINGLDLIQLGVGESAEVSGARCSVTVEGTDRGTVALSSDC